MPTIPQLPPANSVLPSDEIPISQGGSVHAVSVGTLLLTAQPVITVQSSSLLGRTSLGSGGPEQIEVGIGMSLSEGTIVANGADHAAYPSTSSLLVGSDLVISNQGSQMLMPTEFLRALFSAGENVAIDSNGVISTIAGTVLSQASPFGSAIGALHVVSSVSPQDIVPLSQAGNDRAITYADFLDGLTIDQAPLAGPAADSDMIWASQTSSTMVSQSLGGIWLWILKKIPTYKVPVVEVATNINLDVTIHNGRLLVCSQAVVITPLLANIDNGFQCQVINISSGNVTLGSGFLTSTGSYTIGPQQAATLQCITYSAGTIIYASMSQASATVASPGQITQLTTSGVTASSITLSWQQPSSGGAPSFYAVKYRQTGSTAWTVASTILAATGYQLTGLQAATSYDIEVQASNGSGLGTASPVLTISTTVVTQSALPLQVSGLTAVATSGFNVQLSWSGQTATNQALTYTILYRLTGSATWTSTVSGVSGSTYGVAGLQAGTSYDFSIFAVNASGAGPTSLVVSATTVAAGGTIAAPGQVTGLVASTIAATTINLLWQQPTSGGTPSSYTVQFRQTGATAWITGSTVVTGTTYQLTGLVPLTSYDLQVQALNAGGAGIYSTMLTVVTAQVSVPSQVAGFAAVATSSSSIQLTWTGQTGINAATTYTIQYRNTGSTAWTSAVSAASVSNYAISGLQSATSYDFSIVGVNAAGAGPISSIVSATTASVGNSVSAITWNLGPSGTYTHASGAIGVNAHVSPSSATVEFGFSTSSVMAPASWTTAVLVNTDLWGAYVPTPSTAGSWYAWVQGIDGSSPSVFPTPFTVQ